jgi:hypothetical protein
MVLDIFDPRTGQTVRIPVPDNLTDERHTGTITASKPVEHRSNNHRQDRPPVPSFDPHFGSRPNSDRPYRSDLDERLWAVT